MGLLLVAISDMVEWSLSSKKQYTVAYKTWAWSLPPWKSWVKNTKFYEISSSYEGLHLAEISKENYISFLVYCGIQYIEF